MSRELMVVEQPDILQQAGMDAPAALCQVYRCYGFHLPDEIPEAGLIVAAQAGDSEPQPVSRDDYFADALDPVRGKAAGGNSRRMCLRKVTRLKNMLVFVFDPET